MNGDEMISEQTLSDLKTQMENNRWLKDMVNSIDLIKSLDHSKFIPQMTYDDFIIYFNTDNKKYYVIDVVDSEAFEVKCMEIVEFYDEESEDDLYDSNYDYCGEVDDLTRFAYFNKVDRKEN